MLNFDKNLQVLHAALGEKVWSKPYIDDASKIIFTNKLGQGIIIVTLEEHNGTIWIHASMSRRNYLPTYEDLKFLHKAVFEPQNDEDRERGYTLY